VGNDAAQIILSYIIDADTLYDRGEMTRNLIHALIQIRYDVAHTPRLDDKYYCQRVERRRAGGFGGGGISIWMIARIWSINGDRSNKNHYISARCDSWLKAKVKKVCSRIKYIDEPDIGGLFEAKSRS